jgi:LPXTG-site transpeptidase (sortase) family protein
MVDRSTGHSGAGCAANLVTIAGVLLLLAGGIAVYPSLRQSIEPTPSSFGEAVPLLRPTVTSIPAPGQVPADMVVLPETPLLVPAQALPELNVIPTPPPDQVGGSLPTRIVIAAIKLDAPITPVGLHQVDGNLTWDVPNYFAAGWLNRSALLGKSGNTVLDGHHNILGLVFANLKDLKAGDPIQLYSGDKKFSYAVTDLHNLVERDQPIAVRIKNAQWIQSTTDERITLVTCWPPNNNTNRLIIVAKPIGTQPTNTTQ